MERRRGFVTGDQSGITERCENWLANKACFSPTSIAVSDKVNYSHKLLYICVPTATQVIVQGRTRLWDDRGRMRVWRLFCLDLHSLYVGCLTAVAAMHMTNPAIMDSPWSGNSGAGGDPSWLLAPKLGQYRHKSRLFDCLSVPGAMINLQQVHEIASAALAQSSTFGNSHA